VIPIKFPQNKGLFYALAILGSASAGAAIMTLVALSTALYAFDGNGNASSTIYIFYYLGIAGVGFFGGRILRKITTIQLGILTSLCSAAIVFFLGSLSEITPKIGLSTIFIVFLLSGLDHPNTMRFFNKVVDKEKKVSFFSIKEASTQIFTLAMPALAAFVIKSWGTSTCFFLDGITYLLACIPWVLLRANGISLHSENEIPKNSNFLGFKYIFSDRNLRLLTFSRILTNFSYVTWMIALPIVLASFVENNTSLFGQEQGFAMSITSSGIILASLLSLYFDKKINLIKYLIWGSSVLSFFSVFLLFFSGASFFIIYISSFLLGLGTYCFRISGITLGQAFTPEAILGEVIIAGDTTTRGLSFVASLIVTGLFRISHFLGVSESFSHILIITFSGFSLISPFLIRNLANKFYQDTKSNAEMDRV